MTRRHASGLRLPTGARLVNSRVWFWDLHGERSVFWEDTLLYRFRVEDLTQSRLCAAQLVEGHAATFKEVCQGFGIRERTFCRILGKLRQGGAAALVPGKTGPKSRRIRTLSLTSDMRDMYEVGRSTYEIASQLGVSPSTVARVLKEHHVHLRHSRDRDSRGRSPPNLKGSA